MVIKGLRECKSLMSSRCSKTLVFLFFCNTLFNNNLLEIYVKDNDIFSLEIFFNVLDTFGRLKDPCLSGKSWMYLLHKESRKVVIEKRPKLSLGQL